MRRILLALGVGLVLFAVTASAAWLIVDGGGLQSGWDFVECDANGVSVTYQDGTPTDSNYDQATVAGIDCTGTLRVTVDIQKSDNSTVGYGVNTGVGSPNIVSLTDPLTPANIADAHHVFVTIVTVGP